MAAWHFSNSVAVVEVVKRTRNKTLVLPLTFNGNKQNAPCGIAVGRGAAGDQTLSAYFHVVYTNALQQFCLYRDIYDSSDLYIHIGYYWH